MHRLADEGGNGPLPEFVEWKDMEHLPEDSECVMVHRRVTWRAGGQTRRVGKVRLHVADEKGDGVAREYPEETELDARVRASTVAVERGLRRVYLRKPAAGPS